MNDYLKKRIMDLEYREKQRTQASIDSILSKEMQLAIKLEVLPEGLLQEPVDERLLANDGIIIQSMGRAQFQVDNVKGYLVNEAPRGWWRWMAKCHKFNIQITHDNDMLLLLKALQGARIIS